MYRCTKERCTKDVQEVYNLCSGRGKIFWGSKDMTTVVIERKLHQLGLVQSFLLQSSHDSLLRKSQLALTSERWGTLSGSVWTKYSLLVFLVFMSSRVFCELSQTMSWAKRKLKRLLCVLKTFFVAVSLDPAWDLAPSSMQGRLEEEWEWGKIRKKRKMRKMRRRSPSCRSSQLAPQLPFDLQPTLNKRPSLPCTDYLWQVIFHRCSNFHDSIRSHLPPDEQRARVLDPSVWPHGIFS